MWRRGVRDVLGPQVGAVIDEQHVARLDQLPGDLVLVLGEAALLQARVVTAGLGDDDPAEDVVAVRSRCGVQDHVSVDERGLPRGGKTEQASTDARGAATSVSRPGCRPPVAASRPGSPNVGPPTGPSVSTDMASPSVASLRGVLPRSWLPWLFTAPPAVAAPGCAAMSVERALEAGSARSSTATGVVLRTRTCGSPCAASVTRSPKSFWAALSTWAGKASVFRAAGPVQRREQSAHLVLGDHRGAPLLFDELHQRVEAVPRRGRADRTLFLRRPRRTGASGAEPGGACQRARGDGAGLRPGALGVRGRKDQ